MFIPKVFHRYQMQLISLTESKLYYLKVVHLFKIPLYNDQLSFNKLYQMVVFITNFKASIARCKKFKNHYDFLYYH